MPSSATSNQRPPILSPSPGIWTKSGATSRPSNFRSFQCAYTSRSSVTFLFRTIRRSISEFAVGRPRAKEPKRTSPSIWSPWAAINCAESSRRDAVCREGPETSAREVGIGFAEYLPALALRRLRQYLLRDRSIARDSCFNCWCRDAGMRRIRVAWFDCMFKMIA
jgi:hypothetical protein